jgi:hypothetical protein
MNYFWYLIFDVVWNLLTLERSNVPTRGGDDAIVFCVRVTEFQEFELSFL